MKKFIFITGLLMSIFFYSCKEEDHGILPPIEGGGTIEVKDGRVTVNPAEYLYAIRNPMKGLREFFGPGYDKVRDEYPYPYGSIIKEYMQWNMLESDIPGETYDEDDLNAPIIGGYCHPTFQERVKKLVEKAGQAWDNDPRVAYVEMGIIGEFGEHHDPDITTVWAPHDQPNHVETRTWLMPLPKHSKTRK